MKTFKKDNIHYCLIRNTMYRQHTIEYSTQINNEGIPCNILLKIQFQKIYKDTVNPDCIYHKHPINHEMSFYLKYDEKVVFYDTDNHKYTDFTDFRFDFDMKEADTDMMCDVAEYVLVNGG